jgi:hypothetical protein
VTVTLQAGDGTARGEGTISAVYADGHFSARVQDEAGEAVPVQGGDRLVVETGGTTLTMEVPLLDASYDRSSGILSGIGPPGAWLLAVLDFKRRDVLVGPDGHYALDWNDQEIRAGAPGEVRVTDEEGNMTLARFTVPLERRYFPIIGKGSGE